ncbi:FUSC family protein [Amycolatopsis sp. PS_44_ISF1]|uniref:FUSC family protein n=1 Tax=Amycolatopsis sp. PS_44_ISF1 TaxID=2974917 RepID=UPI0028DEA675|nr:FUSC family protein [Amycolatopsis sp. PS_44_ISF1]MDT8912869.1 FUSC family protein [Amycolatopsis sp. PS_44_ISF1]
MLPRGTDVRDRVIASDPGLSRLRSAGSATVSMGSALGVEYAFAEFSGAGAMGTVIAMLLGAIVAMMGSMALGDGSAWVKARTAAFFPVSLGLGLLLGVAVGPHARLMLAVFVGVMFVAVFVRRFGPAFFFYGFMGWMGYFFASFLHATLEMMPALLLAVVLASAWVLLLSVTVLRTNPTRTLRRVLSAFDARGRELARTCADLLATTDPQREGRLRRRLQARQARLAEAGLMVEGWSAQPGALPAGRSPAALRRSMVDAHHLLDQLATAADALVRSGSGLSVLAAEVADRLARRDDRGAGEVAHRLAALAEHAGGPAGGWWPARHFAAAALEVVAVLDEAPRPETPGTVVVDDFEPAVGLAFGNLPGSAATAGDVPARHRGWNPLSRLDFVSRQAIQGAVAGGLAILVGKELSSARYYWAVLAAFIMFTGTATRTETFLKGFNRVLGTLAGLLASIGFAELTAGSTTAVLITICGAMFCGFYLLRLSYAYMIFFMTIMIGQLYTVLNEFSAGLLVLRLEETAAGAVVGLAVALLVTPLSTRDTVRAARDHLLTALGELLTAAAGRLEHRRGGPEPDFDALTRTVDHRFYQLALIARPLGRPILGGTNSPRLRHRISLYAALATHGRALAVAVRRPGNPGATRPDGPVAACRALAAAVAELAAARPGDPQPAAAAPLARADVALFAHTPAAPGERAKDPVLRALGHVHHVLRELTATGPVDLRAAPSLPAPPMSRRQRQVRAGES